MTLLPRVCLALVVFACAVRAAQRDIVRTFPVERPPSLSIDTYRGSITIEESEQPEIRVSVHLAIGADSEAEADEMLKTLLLEWTDAGGTVGVRARRPAETRARFVWNDRKQIEPTFRVRVPKACNLKLKTIAGAIIVGNVRGVLQAETEAGDVYFRAAGGSVSAHSDAGDVVVSRCEGDLKASVGVGLIRVGTVTGACEVRNTSGDVEVQGVRGDLKASVEAGTATIGIHRAFHGEARVSSSGGSIVLKVDPATRCDIDAHASVFSKVASRLPLVIQSGGSGERALVGRLNGGGGRIVLRSSGGDVFLKTDTFQLD